MKFQKDIEAVCQRYGAWCTITHDKQPDLKWIRIETTARIGPKNKEGNRR